MNSYLSESESFKRNQHILRNKSDSQVFFKNQIILNPYFALKCIVLEFDTF